MQKRLRYIADITQIVTILSDCGPAAQEKASQFVILVDPRSFLFGPAVYERFDQVA